MTPNPFAGQGQVTPLRVLRLLRQAALLTHGEVRRRNTNAAVKRRCIGFLRTLCDRLKQWVPARDPNSTDSAPSVNHQPVTHGYSPLPRVPGKLWAGNRLPHTKGSAWLGLPANGCQCSCRELCPCEGTSDRAPTPYRASGNVPRQTTGHGTEVSMGAGRPDPRFRQVRYSR